MTFNDANITGNYDVLHAKLSKPFRDQFSSARLKEAFKAFADNNVDFKVVAAKTPIAKQEPSVKRQGRAVALRSFRHHAESRLLRA